MLFSFNPGKLFLPASTAKIFTTAAALDGLGPGYRFRTALYAAPRTKRDGTLLSNLYVRGYGDPSLDREGIDRIATAVASAGVRRVEGRLVVDTSYFDEVPLGPGWMWDDEEEPFSAQVSALSYHENVADIAIAPGPEPGAPVQVHVEPEGHPLLVRVRATTGPPGSRSHVQVHRLRGRNTVIVSGSMALDGPAVRTRRTVEGPHLFAARALALALERAGVQLARARPVVGRTPPGVRELAVEASQPLPLVLTVMNWRDHSLYAEQVIKALGAQQLGQGSWPAGTAVVRDFLARHGVAEGPCPVLADGSGLSRYNLIAPEHVVRLLEAMHRHEARNYFWGSLAVAGQEGILADRLVGTPLAGNLVGIAGAMQGVSAFSGYLMARSGHVVAFSMLTNGFVGDPGPIQRAEDRVVLALWEHG